MALDANSAIGQAEVSNNKLSEYFNEIYRFLNDTSGLLAMPDFKDYVESLDYSELHRMSSIRVKDASSYENGATLENIHNMVSILREFNLRSKGKIEYYGDGASDAQKESDYYATQKVRWVNMLSGNYTEGQA